MLLDHALAGDGGGGGGGGYPGLKIVHRSARVHVHERGFQFEGGGDHGQFWTYTFR